MSYWITIKGQLERDKSLELYDKIKPYEANMMVLDGEMHIYGKASESCVKEILYLSGLLEMPLQLNIG